MKKRSKLQVIALALILLFILNNSAIAQQCHANFSFSYITNESIQFNDLSTYSSGYTIDNWNWNFGDGSYSAEINPMYTYTLPGIYNVELSITDYNGYTNSVIYQVSVTHIPALDFTWNYGCEGEPVQFTILSPPTDIPAVASWLWDFGDGSAGVYMEPTYVYSNIGTYNVSLTIMDTIGATNTVTKQITINPPPVSLFSIQTPACVNNPVQFNNYSTSPTGYITDWHWDFGDGTAQTVIFPDDPDVTHIYTNTGTYIITLSVTNSDSCSNSTQNTVTTISGPMAAFTYEATCTNAPVFFIDLSSSNGGPNIHAWSWDFGDTTSGTNNTSNLQNPAHIYSYPSNYDVNLVVSNIGGCTDTTFSTVVITDPGLEFIYTGDCFGSITYFEVDESITNVAEVQSWLWDFGDGGTSTLQNPTYLYTVGALYGVTLSIITNNNCTADIIHDVFIYDLPVVSISASTNITTINMPVQFYGSSSSGNNSNWLWEFGDGNTATIQNPVHSYQSYNIFDVILTVIDSSGCTNSDTTQIQVAPPPVFPDSMAIWNTLGYSFGTQEWRYRYGLIGDTTLSYTKDTSYTYSKVYNLSDSTLTVDNAIYFGAIRTTDDKKVYLKLPELPETILYDYSLEIGDTIWFSVGGFAASGDAFFEENTHYKVITNKDSTLLLDNNYHTRWYLHGEVMNDVWIEGVGSVTWFGLFNPIISDMTTNGNSFSLACFKQNGIPLFIDNPDCDKCFCYLLSEIDEQVIIDSKEINIYPNPSSDVVHISTTYNSNKDFKLNIYNSIGQLVYQNQNSNSTTINVNNWSKGLYIVTFSRSYELLGTSEFVIK